MDDNNPDWNPDQVKLESELIIDGVVRTDVPFTVSYQKANDLIPRQTDTEENLAFPERTKCSLLPLPKPDLSSSGFVAVNVKKEPIEGVTDFPVSHQETTHHVPSAEQSSVFPEQFEQNLAYGLPSVPKPASSPGENVIVKIKEEPTEDMTSSTVFHIEGGQHIPSETYMEQSEALPVKIELNLAYGLPSTSSFMSGASQDGTVMIKEETTENMILSSEQSMERTQHQRHFVFLRDRNDVSSQDNFTESDDSMKNQPPDIIKSEAVTGIDSTYHDTKVCNLDSKSSAVVQSPDGLSTNGTVLMELAKTDAARSYTTSPPNEQPSTSTQPPPSSLTHANFTSRAATEEKRFPCDQCPAKFTRKYNLKNHIMTHAIGKPFSCNHCTARFNNKNSLRAHLYIHTNERRYSCDQCSAGFNHRSSLRTHLLSHSDKRPFSCDQCPVGFNRKSDLRSHLLIHANEKPFSCGYCPARFNQKTNLRTHILTHTNEKPFLCDYCSAQFSRKCNLRTHLLIHSDEKPFLCKLCPAWFTRKDSLQNHLVVHSNEKPFSCDYCSARFKRKATLITHSLIHKNKPFSCDRCFAQFNWKGSLKKHLLTHSK